MKKLLSGFILLLFTCLPLHAQSTACLSALEEYFSKEVSKEAASEFLALQGELTLNRLSWAYLKSLKNNEDGKIESFERTIIELLNEKYSNTDPAFIKAREAFEAQPLSRTTLMDVAPYLKDYFAKEHEKEDELFLLNESDVKLLGVLAKYEGKTSSGDYDHRMLKTSPQSILNFAKLINSSYQNYGALELVDENLELLENTMNGIQEKMAKVFADVKLPPECDEDKECHPDFVSLLKASEEVQMAVLKGILKDKVSDTEILNNLGYGDIWPKVKNKKQAAKKLIVSPSHSNSSPSSKKTNKNSSTVSQEGKRYGSIKKVSNVPGKSIKTKSTQTQKTQKKNNDSGPSTNEVLISDPVSVIVKDKKGRKASNWAGTEQSYKMGMAEAILNDDKVFEYKGELYLRQNGKRATEESALALVPPKKRKEYLDILNKVKNSQFKTRMIKTMVNGDKTFIYDGKLYTGSGKLIKNPEALIVNLMNQKTKKNYKANRYDGMDKGYLVARGNALSNNRPYFVHNGRVMDTFSGRNVNNSKRPEVDQNVKLNKEKRKMYEYMDNLDVIRNYHRDEIGGSCNHYGVIDKKTAKLTIYKKDGSAVLSKEVLLGSKSGDKRTYWTDYANKRTSQTTGAGVFTVRKSNPNDSYNKKTFNNNILSFYDESGKETVFAIHQVPVNLQSRNSRFGTGDADDRRLSNGCANLKVSDFHDVEKYLGVACKVYVLPEEANNKFTYRDDKIKLVNADGVEPDTDKFYNYSSLKSDALPISINITNKEARNKTSEKFVKALADEKPKLMKALGISNDEYNELALIAFGVMGNESKFGESFKLYLKEGGQDIVKLAKFVTSGDVKASLNTSRGYTQIKYLPEDVMKKYYPEISKSTLIKPEHSAIATVVYLAEAFNTMKGIVRENEQDPKKLRITQETMIKYIGYFYQGGRSKVTTTKAKDQATPEWNEYYQGLVRNMSFLEITQGTN